jgi:uncharacterized protein (TIGR01244 family)
MRALKVSDKLHVASQPALEHIEQIIESGFAAVINNRPEGEEPGQLPAGDVERVLKRAGRTHVHIPVTLGSFEEHHVREFQKAVAQADGPVLAHCKSGTRALSLHVVGEVLDGRMEKDAVVAFGVERGFDLSAAKNWLDRRETTAKSTVRPKVKAFFDPRTWSVQYVVSDPATRKCAIIDPVLDYDEKSGATGTAHADAILAYIKEENLEVEWILDTHPHADHFSAAHYLKERTGAPTAIGAHVVDVQRLWKDIYNWPQLKTDGSQWDRLFEDGERFKVGNIDAEVMFSPGHTLASITYKIGDAAFVHDTLFMPDSGTARADFPGGSAKVLWDSIQRILALPNETRLFTGHDYQPGGREPKWEATVGEQKRSNPHIAGVSEAEFIALREARDKTLPMPKLILHALQVNVRGGRLPDPESNGRSYLKIPLNALQTGAW